MLTVKYLVDFMANARPEDLQEVLIGSGRHFEDCTLAELVEAGNLCLVDTEDDSVYAIGGIANENVIWMLCTSKVEKHFVKFLRYCRETLRYLLEDKKILYNNVWKENELHVKWLKWMGAEFLKETDTHILFIFRKRKEALDV